MLIQGFDRYKVLSTAIDLNTFTVRDLAAQSLVSEQHVQKIISRSSDLFDGCGTISQGRGRPAKLYRIYPDRVDLLRRELHAHREELRQVMGVSTPEPEPEFAEEGLLPLRIAEIELYDRFEEAKDTQEQISVLERARNLLIAVRNSGQLSPNEEPRLSEAEKRLSELSSLFSSHDSSEPGPAADSRANMNPYLALSPQERALLNRPISDLNLPLEIRKLAARLGVTLIGEIFEQTGHDIKLIMRFVDNKPTDAPAGMRSQKKVAAHRS
ncbi:hypothetical protein Mal52_13580 [Symmachiella dynata]|uniref:Uncharacterized protein n=1 Tax=Symmachiella dynata TaxID=2527995 RepID=A0A517ZK70_9PLAN|nr:hypothetical protein [Symmachiella dynata]QDU42889.1 hypothetical protein Mal52_13580 [Symmachiella dynata]